MYFIFHNCFEDNGIIKNKRVAAIKYCHIFASYSNSSIVPQCLSTGLINHSSFYKFTKIIRQFKLSSISYRNKHPTLALKSNFQLENLVELISTLLQGRKATAELDTICIQRNGSTLTTHQNSLSRNGHIAQLYVVQI